MPTTRASLLKLAARRSLTPEEGRLLLAMDEDEETLLQFTREAFVKKNDWLFYHTRRSDKSDAGFYDVVAAHPTMGRMIFAELKRYEKRNARTADQRAWGDFAELLAAAIAGAIGLGPDSKSWPISYYLWTPADKDEILAVAGWRR